MNAEAPVILQIKNLTKKFAAEGGKMLTACDNVTLNAYAGQTLGIIGESGCGKSTLVRTILQIHPASGGEVIFDGQDILKLRGEAARQNRRKIQMVFQDPAAAFNPKMKVKEIRELSNEEINAKLKESKEELFNLRFSGAMGNLEKPSRLRELRHQVARLKTVLKEREKEEKVD